MSSILEAYNSEFGKEKSREKNIDVLRYFTDLWMICEILYIYI